jgi:transposase
MRGRLSKYQVQLNPKRRKRLLSVIRRRQPSHWLVIRAKLVLMSGTGARIVDTCAALSMDRQVVRRWCRRFIEGGMDALKDRPRTGRPSTIASKVWQKVATLVVQSPSKFGLPFERWSVRDLSSFLQSRYKWRVSRSSLSRFLRSMAFLENRSAADDKRWKLLPEIVGANGEPLCGDAGNGALAPPLHARARPRPHCVRAWLRSIASAGQLVASERCSVGLTLVFCSGKGAERKEAMRQPPTWTRVMPPKSRFKLTFTRRRRASTMCPWGMPPFSLRRVTP